MFIQFEEKNKQSIVNQQKLTRQPVLSAHSPSRPTLSALPNAQAAPAPLYTDFQLCRNITSVAAYPRQRNTSVRAKRKPPRRKISDKPAAVQPCTRTRRLASD